MLIMEVQHRVGDSVSSKPLEDYLKGVFDASSDDFNEEDHPRGGKGSEAGGRFVKSEKTKRKEDEQMEVGGTPKSKLELSNHVHKIVKETLAKLREQASDPRNAIHNWVATGSVGLPNDDEVAHTGTVSISGYCGTKEQFETKVKAARESAQEAIEYLSKQTGKKWGIIAQEMYNKDNEEVKDDSSWENCDDVTFVFGSN